MSTLQELLEQQRALAHQIEEAKKSQRQQAIAQIRQIMSVNGLTPDDLSAPVAKPKTGEHATKKVQPKYRHPNGATWSGRGLKPRWLTEELAKGKTISDFAI